MQRSGKLPVLFFFYSEDKNQHIRTAGATRCTDSREIWHSRAPRGSAWTCEISPQSAHGVRTRPQSINNFHFLVKIRPWPIYTNARGFYASNYHG